MTRIWPLPCEGLGNYSYLAEVDSGLALAVDPGRDPRPYLSLAAAHGLRVAFTADTHAPTREVIRLLAWTYPDWTVHEVPSGGHMAPLSRPDLINPLVRSFLLSDTNAWPI